MARFSRIAAFGIVLGAGLAILASIPTDGSTIGDEGNATTLAASASSASSPNPDLLRRLDAAIASPAVASINPSKQGPLATAQAVSLTSSSGDLSVSRDAAPEATFKSDKVGKSTVTLRAGPSSSTRRLAVLHPGEVVQIEQTARGWAQVVRTDGSTGWVYSSFLSSSAVTKAAAPKPKRPRKPAQPHVVAKEDSNSLDGGTMDFPSLLSTFGRSGASTRSIFTFDRG